MYSEACTVNYSSSKKSDGLSHQTFPLFQHHQRKSRFGPNHFFEANPTPRYTIRVSRNSAPDKAVNMETLVVNDMIAAKIDVRYERGFVAWY